LIFCDGLFPNSTHLCIVAKEKNNVVLLNQPIHEYLIIGRRIPSEKNPNPPLYKMNIFSTDSVRAQSRFWYFMSKLKKLKKTNGEIVTINEVYERRPTQIKNFGMFLRYSSRSGVHNFYKEFRACKKTDAVQKLYADMAGRHRARNSTIQIISVDVVPNSKARKDTTFQFINSQIKFPIPHRRQRVPKAQRSIFIANRPRTHFG